MVVTMVWSNCGIGIHSSLRAPDRGPRGATAERGPRGRPGPGGPGYRISEYDPAPSRPAGGRRVAFIQSGTGDSMITERASPACAHLKNTDPSTCAFSRARAAPSIRVVQLQEHPCSHPITSILGMSTFSPTHHAGTDALSSHKHGRV